MKNLLKISCSTKYKCLFCNTSSLKYLDYGELYKLNDVVVHYFCLLLSTEMVQKGKDNEGILGFLLTDIKAILKKSKSARCCYCNCTNATIYCCNKKCFKKFHLNCGLKNFSLHQFKGSFQSYCCEHRPQEKIPQPIVKKGQESDVTCPICYQGFKKATKKYSMLWASCCGNAWFHKICIQLLAHNAGYFFKCPMCNNKNKFTSDMQELGVFVPQRDASWEMEPNAFQDLLFRYDKCDAEFCLSPFGREQSIEESDWKIILCQLCGSQGIHKSCGKLKHWNSKWKCTVCLEASQRNQSTSKNRESSGSSLKLTSDSSSRRNTKRKKSSSHAQRKRRRIKSSEPAIVEKSHESDESKDDEGKESEELEEINVVDVELETNMPHQTNVLHALSKLKPGPLSYKLNSIKNIFGNSKFNVNLFLKSQNSELNCKRPEPETIVLSDSEEENDVEIDKMFKILTAKQCFDTCNSKKEQWKFIKPTEAPKEYANSVNKTQVPKNQDEQSISILPDLLNNFEIVGSIKILLEENE